MIQKEEKRVEKAAAEERRNKKKGHWNESHFFWRRKNCCVAFFCIRETTFSRVFFLCIVYTKYRHMYVTYRVIVDSDMPRMRTSIMSCVL